MPSAAIPKNHMGPPEFGPVESVAARRWIDQMRWIHKPGRVVSERPVTSGRSSHVATPWLRVRPALSGQLSEKAFWTGLAWPRLVFSLWYASKVAMLSTLPGVMACCLTCVDRSVGTDVLQRLLLIEQCGWGNVLAVLFSAQQRKLACDPSG
jgi:hypothetical protein